MLFPAASSTLSIMRDSSMSLGQAAAGDASYSLLRCCTNGRFDSTKFLQLRRRERDREFDEAAEVLVHDDDWGENDPPTAPKKKRQKRIILARRGENGELEAVPPKESLWYNQYIACPQPSDERFLKKFRRRFRLPYSSFVKFVEDAKEGDWFPRNTGQNCAGKNASPLELLILGSFRYLGRGWTFDDLEEVTAISEEVHRVFFHRFIEVGSTILFDKYVRAPTTAAEAAQHMLEFELAGMPGTPGSSDATHIVHEKCSWRLRRSHLGWKSKSPTRTYNTTVNHRRRILATTTGHPGSWNDKTLVLFDAFIRDIKRGDILQDNTFELLEKRGEEVVKAKYRGVWVVVDNGYHAWAITVPPFSNTQLRDEIRRSEWVESMRKDVECTFGILKGRWRILKTGVRLHSTDSVDKIWQTCCALHNMLLEVDGLDKPWDGGVGVPTSEWEGPLGDLEMEEGVPLSLRRILSPAQIRAYDTTALGAPVAGDQGDGGQEDGGAPGDAVAAGPDEVRVVNKLSLKYFRSKLVEHFNIKFRLGELVWPRSRGAAPIAWVDM